MRLELIPLTFAPLLVSMVFGQDLPPLDAPPILPDDEILEVTPSLEADSFFDSPEPAVTRPGFVRSGPNTKINFTYIGGQSEVLFTGDPRIEGANGLEANADRIRVDINKQIGYLTGNVSIYQDGLVYRGESAIYHHKTRKFNTEKLRAGMDPLLLEAGQFRSTMLDGRPAYIGENAGITTHDSSDPHWWLRTGRTTIFPGERVIFKDLKLYAGKTPVFWLPYLSQPLNAELGYHLAPGGRSNLGLFLKNRYGIMIGGERDPVSGLNDSAWLLAHYHADIYTRRGLGLGLSLYDSRVESDDQFGWLKFYYIHDLSPQTSRSGAIRPPVNENRYLVEFAHRRELRKTQNAIFSAEANISWLSDDFYLEDFDPSRYNQNPAPDNTLALSRRTANSFAQLGTRVRPNSFYQSDTRLPELSYDWIRQPFLHSEWLYESQTSAGVYREHLGDFNIDRLRAEAALLGTSAPRQTEIAGLLDPAGFSRFHTYHEFSRPFKVGHLNLVPEIGGGYTYYGAAEGQHNSVSRTHLFAGVDASMKFTKAYPKWIDDQWGLNGALHVFEPYANLSVLSTDELNPTFDRVDRLTASTRPRQRSVGRFTAIDDLANWNIMRLGMKNSLLTHRNGGTHEWLTINTYFDTFFDDPEFNRNFSNLYNEIRWSPLPWLDLDLDTQIPLFNDSNFTEVATTATFMPTDDIELSLRHRILKDHPILRDSNRLELDFYARLNEHWGIGTRHRWEIVDGTLELQNYNLYRDFDSWVGSAGFFVRDNRIENEYGLMLSFGLKEFPNLNLPIRMGAE